MNRSVSVFFICLGLSAAAQAVDARVAQAQTAIPFLAEDVRPEVKGVSCYNKRGQVNYRVKDKKIPKRKGGGTVEEVDKDWAVDSVLWCPPDHPNIVHCDSIDDFAPMEGPTVLKKGCQNDGPCDAAENYDRKRKDNDGDQSREGPQNRMHEFVVQENEYSRVEGCWGYDRGGKHRPYRLEILCCAFPREAPVAPKKK